MKNIIQKTGLAAILLAAMLQASAANWKNISNFSEVTSFAVRGNEVWVSGKGGLMKYDKTSGAKTYFKKGVDELPSLAVERVAVHPMTNDIWIGTYDNGIARFNGTNWTQISLPETKGILYEMKIAADGSVWSLTSTGLYCYRNGQFYSYMTTGIQSPDLCWDFDFLPDGKILCAHFQPFIFNPANDSTESISTTGFAYGSSRVLTIDSNHFAFADDHGTLCLFANNTETDSFHLSSMATDLQMHNGNLLALLGNENILMEKTVSGWVPLTFGNGVISAFKGENNELWAGTNADLNKVLRLNAQLNVEEIDIRRTEMLNNQVQSIINTADGNVLITHGAGIQKYDVAADEFSKEWEISLPNVYFSEAIELNGKVYAGTSYQYLYEFFSADSFRVIGNGYLPKAQVDHFAADDAGNLWLCGPGYIAKYDGNSFTIFNSANNSNLTSNLYLRDIHCDDTRDAVWVASYDGIFKIQNGVMSFYNENTAGIQQYYDAVETISEDAQHNIWFGTVYGAVLKYDGTYFSTMLLPETAGNQFVSGIAFADNGMYVSDNLNGVWRYENNKWDSLNMRNSAITSDYITSLLTDSRGNLWIGNPSYGLDVYNKNGIELSISDKKNDAIMASLFPNPSSGKFVLQLLNADETLVKVFSIDGKLMEQIKPTSFLTTIDLTDKASGLYFVHVTNGKTESILKAIRY